MNTEQRRREFRAAVNQYNTLYHNGVADVDGNEAWEVFRQLLGRADRDAMMRAIHNVYSDRIFMRYVRERPEREEQIRLMRSRARNATRVYRERQRQPYPRPAVLAPLPVRPVVGQAPQAQPPPPLAVFDLFRTAIMQTGFIDGGQFAMLQDQLTPEQVEALFSLMTDRGECPICLVTMPKLFRWTYECNHSCCAPCMNAFVNNAMRSANFPVQCPGKCGISIDPRRIIEALSTTGQRGITTAPEVVVRFVSMQLASTTSVAPETASEMHACPTCRTVVCGRPSATSPMARCTYPFCAQRFCTNCKTPWHEEGVGCAEHAVNDKASISYINGTSKPCPMCGRMSSHFRGHACHHLRCVCGHEYCFECLHPWSEHAVGKLMEGCRIFCHPGCRCVPCDECRPGKPCKTCTTGCEKCKVTA